MIRGAICAALALASAVQAQSPPLVLAHVAVIDATGAPARPNMTIVIERGRIVLVAPTEGAPIPAGARVLDVTGKYVIPGLWDMHVHLGQWPAAALGLLVAHGVTGVRDMGTNLPAIKARRREIADGRVGPRIVAAGAILDGPGHTSEERLAVPTAADARRVVDSLAEAGADFVKVYEYLPRDVFLAVADQARTRGLTLTGHVPRDVGAIPAVDAGERSIEHLSGVPLSCPLSMRWAARTPGLSGVLPPCGDDRARARVFDRFRERGALVTPTLVSFRGVARATDAASLGTAAEPRMRYVTPALRRHWDEQIAKWPKLVPSSYRRGLADMYARLTRAAHDAHVPIMAGSDLGNTLVFPGSSLHEELEMLVAAGLSPGEALAAATSTPARFLGISDSLGTVEVGKIADLVVLDDNPLADIRNVSRVHAVIRAGTLLDREALDRLLAERRPEMTQP